MNNSAVKKPGSSVLGRDQGISFESDCITSVTPCASAMERKSLLTAPVDIQRQKEGRSALGLEHLVSRAHAPAPVFLHGKPIRSRPDGWVGTAPTSSVEVVCWRD